MGTRRTYSFTVGGLAAGFVGIYLWYVANPVFAIIAGIVAFFIGFFVTRAIEDALHKGINKVAYSGSRKMQDKALSSTPTFVTSVGKERIISAFLSKYQSQAKAVAWKANWICKRFTDGNNDKLLFAIGITSFEYINSASFPKAVAQLVFDKTPDGKTKAVFEFVSSIDYDDGSVTWGKEMAQLVEDVHNTFANLDPSSNTSAGAEYTQAQNTQVQTAPQTAAPHTPAARQPAAVHTSTAKQTATAHAPTNRIDFTKGWVCPKCGWKNSAGQSDCIGCGCFATSS